MRQAAHRVRVGLRHLVLAEDAELLVLEDGGAFVALRDPPPVRAVIELVGEGGRQAFEVTGVVEVPDGDPQGRPGIYGRIVDVAELDRLERVGTEALEDVVTPPVSEAEGGVEESSASPMGTPAPVITDDDSGSTPTDEDGATPPSDAYEAEAGSPSDSTSEGTLGDTHEAGSPSDSTSEGTLGDTHEGNRSRRRRARNKR